MKHSCKDWELYHQAGLDSLYETAGNLNLFLICEKPEPSDLRPLPEGCFIRTCRPDELNVWKHLAAEEQYADSLTDYYERVYAGSGRRADGSGLLQIRNRLKFPTVSYRLSRPA